MIFIQLAPENPLGHQQVYEAPFGLHTPPLRQGLVLHGVLARIIPFFLNIISFFFL